MATSRLLRCLSCLSLSLALLTALLSLGLRDARASPFGPLDSEDAPPPRKSAPPHADGEMLEMARLDRLDAMPSLPTRDRTPPALADASEGRSLFVWWPRQATADSDSDFDYDPDAEDKSTSDAEQDRTRGLVEAADGADAHRNTLVHPAAASQDSASQDTVDQETVDQDTVDQDIMSDEAMSPSTAGQNAETSSLASQVVASPGSIWGWSFNHAEDEPGLAELVAEGRLTELLWKTMNKRTSAIKTTLPPKPRPVLLSMPIPPPAISELRLTLERHLPALWHDRMHHLWAAGRNFTIESKIPFPNGQFITLQGRHWSQMDISGRPPSKILIIVNGRTETFLRYREDLHDALSMGWDVWMYDHRGQGVNTARMCSRPHLGTINSYQEYDDDFDQVLTEVILPWREAMDYEHIPIVMRGHSLGGVIAIRAAMRHPDVFQRVALTSPAVRLRSRGVGYRLFDFLNRWQGSVCDTLPWYYEPPKVELTVDYYRTCTMTSYTRFLMQFEAVLKYDDPSRMISGASYRWLSEIKRIGDDLTALPGETDGEVSGSAAAASIWLTKAELNPSPKTKNLIPEDRLYQNEVLKTPTFVAYDLLDEVIDPEGQKALKRKYPDMIRLSEFRGLHHQMWSAADIHRVPLMYQIYEFLKSDSPRP